MARTEAKGKSLHKSQRGPRVQHFYHHHGQQGHTRPNCHKLRALKNASDQRLKGPKNAKGIGLLSNQEVKMVISV